MTRQDIIRELQNQIGKNRIQNIDDLKLEISCAEYEGDEPIDEYEDVIFPMGYNTCDKCGAIGDSELDLFWIDGFDWEDGNPKDEAIIRGLQKEKADYCAICYLCLHEIMNNGRDSEDVEKAKKYYTEEYVIQVKRENGGEPVCFDEFYWNDWQDIRKVLTK